MQMIVRETDGSEGQTHVFDNELELGASLQDLQDLHNQDYTVPKN